MNITKRKINEDELKIKIYSLYKNEYSKFMNISNIPDININFANETKFSVKGSMPLTLNANKKLLYYRWNTEIPHLFHELTHIQDDYTYYPQIPMNERIRMLKAYSEIHATIVELKYATGFKNDTDKKIITLNSPIINSHKDVNTVSQYLEMADSILKNEIDHYIKTQTSEAFYRMLDETLYSVGRLYFIRHYILEPESINYVTQLFRAIDIFGEELKELVGYGVADNISEDDISIIGLNYTRIVSKYQSTAYKTE